MLYEQLVINQVVKGQAAMSYLGSTVNAGKQYWFFKPPSPSDFQCGTINELYGHYARLIEPDNVWRFIMIGFFSFLLVSLRYVSLSVH